MAEYGYLADKEALINRLHRIEGQVRGIERMVDEERYCIDILTQISAATTALDSIALKLLEGHVGSCVATALASGDEDAAAREEQGADRRRAAVREGPVGPMSVLAILSSLGDALAQPSACSGRSSGR